MQYHQLINYKQARWRKPFMAMGLLMCIISVIYLMVGEVSLPLQFPWSEFQQQIFINLRLPRLLAVMVIGAALAVSGASLQVLLGNPLAEPGIIGISGGSSLGMVILLFCFPLLASVLGTMLAAIGGALVFTFIIVGLAKSMNLTTARLLLVGVALGILSSSAVTWAFYFSDNFNLRILMYWLMGSVGGITWQQLSVTILMLPCIAWLCTKGRELDLLMVGEKHAQQLGLDVAALRWKLIVVVAILVGCSVAIGGVISFIGLVLPHLIRLTLGSENRYLLPMSALCGATLLVLADLFARISLNAAELPLGVVTTSIGAPIFIWLLLRHYDKY
ncbi:vitamin B12 ABC transporter permease BtuC [Vibrio sp. S11_S32]|uniref:vitamin B12 ABC transporter permease BtuC n=1 Tax=Vibrio sp. S11_S32 TaxID=2720225 RepID=UPI001681939A|nr:vitamin B12 ABC transporter permease BtuC [Vibrio sp. S11_S32]MBD1577552.1 vitamin B12 ABC transporter permease BtuC [Vibrio sp. S11_S32]